MKKVTETKNEGKMVNLAVLLVGSKIYKTVNTAKGQVSRKLPMAKESGFLVEQKEAKEFIRAISDNDKSKYQKEAEHVLKNWDKVVPEIEGVYGETFNKKKVNMTKVSKVFYALKEVLSNDKRTDAEKVQKAKEMLEEVENED